MKTLINIKKKLFKKVNMSIKKTGLKTVVVTGASSGIGLSIVEKLSSNGFYVIAGVRSQRDIDRVKKLNPNIYPVYLDVTRQFDIDNLAFLINSEFDGELYALVNNAGVMKPSPIELSNIEDLREEIEVNYIGPVNLTKKLLPFLRDNIGRVVNISSMNGKLSMPACGGYSGSKFALEAFSDALRIEVYNSGMKVSIIEPGQTRTSIFSKALMAYEKIEFHSQEDREYYSGILNALGGAMNGGLNSELYPESVADSVYDALVSNDPSTRYIIGEDAKSLLALANSMSDKAMDAQIMNAFGLIPSHS